MTMLIDYAYVALTATLVPWIRFYGPGGQTEAKESLFIVLAGLMLGYCLATGTMPGLNGPAQLFTVFVGWILLSVLWSDSPRFALQEFPRWAAVLFFFLICQRGDPNLTLQAVFALSPFLALYGIYQAVLGKDPFSENYTKSIAGQKAFYSWLGNANYCGAYLAPCFFIGLHLGLEITPWYFVPTGIVMLGLVVTKCRASLVGLFAGFAVLPEIWPYALFLGIAVIGIASAYKPASILARKIYVQIAWRIGKKRLACGWGPQAYRRKYFRAQADLSKEDPTILGTPDSPGRHILPYGEYSHNEYAETVVEFGLVGLVLFLGVTGLCVYQGFSSPVSLLLLSGLAAALVNAWFFYSFRMASTVMPIMALMGILSASSTVVLPIQWILAIVVVIGVGRLIWATEITRFIAYRHFYRMNTEEDANKKLREGFKAVKWAPYENLFLLTMARAIMPAQPHAAMVIMERALHNDDGTRVAWAMQFTFAQTAFANHAYLVARDSLQHCIYLNPSNPEFYNKLALTNRFIDEEVKREKKAQKKKQKRNIVKPTMRQVIAASKRRH